MRAVFSPEYDIFRQCMIAARKNAKLTQATLAKSIKKPQSFVAKYENGERRLDVIEFLQVARVIGIDPCNILREVEQKFADTSCREER
jgi:transcriptional regulator with XRE-family HTH domain